MNSKEKFEHAKQIVPEYASSFPDIPLITTERVLELRASAKAGKVEEPVLVDVRSDSERNVSTIPGSISREDFESRELQSLKGRCVVPYCTIGVRSGRYALRLKKSGFTDVHNGEGVLLWSHVAQGDDKLVKVPAVATTELPSGNGTPGASCMHSNVRESASHIHVFSPRFDLAADGYTPVTFTQWEKTKYVAACWWYQVFESDKPVG